MASNFGLYKVGDRDVLDSDFFNKRFRDLDLRIGSLEGINVAWEEVIDQFQTIGLERLNEALVPVLEVVETLADLGVLFSAHSETELTITDTGQITLILNEEERQRFAPGLWLAAIPTGTSGKYMVGQKVSYSKETGALVIEVTSSAGSGTYSDWSISHTSIPQVVTADGVISFANRQGIVVPTAGDYAASEVDNDSTVAGATVKAALEALDAAKAASGHSHAYVTSFAGRNGAVSPQANDYAASEIENDSGVAGATVKAAIDALNAAKLALSGGTLTNTLWVGVGGGTEGYLSLVRGNATNTGYVEFRDKDGVRAGYVGFADATKLYLQAENGRVIQLTTGATVNGNAIWHAGNDGPASGLDADTVDGSHASAFATSGHNHTGVYATSAHTHTGLGAWESKTIGTTYQAATDGFVVFYASKDEGKTSVYHGYSDANSNPTTVRAHTKGYEEGVNTSYASFMFPVKKNDYYKILRTGVADTSAAMFWIPLGA